MFLSREKIEGGRCMSAEDSNVKGSSQQSSTSFPKVKGGGPLFSGPGPLITGEIGKRYYTGFYTESCYTQSSFVVIHKVGNVGI